MTGHAKSKFRGYRSKSYCRECKLSNDCSKRRDICNRERGGTK